MRGSALPFHRGTVETSSVSSEGNAPVINFECEDFIDNIWDGLAGCVQKEVLVIDGAACVPGLEL